MTNTKATGKAAAEKGKPRKLVIERVANTALYGLRFEGGGELPDDMKDQFFTNPQLAQDVINDYESAKA